MKPFFIMVSSLHVCCSGIEESYPGSYYMKDILYICSWLYQPYFKSFLPEAVVKFEYASNIQP